MREQRIIAARQRNVERRSVGDYVSVSVLRDGAVAGERGGSEMADLDDDYSGPLFSTTIVGPSTLKEHLIKGFAMNDESLSLTPLAPERISALENKKRSSE